MASPIKHLQLIVQALDEPVPGVKRLLLVDQDGWRLPAFRPGAHIDLHLDSGVVRTYSLCNDPEDNRRYIVAVKKETNGRGGSRYVHETLQPGQIIGVSVPRCGLEFTDSAMNVFIAGGIGVTPFVSAIRTLEHQGRDNYVLHWASMGPPSLIDMLQPALAAGRVHLYDTRQVAPPDLGALIACYGGAAKAFCCGPGGMLDAFEALVSDWPEDRKHVERFVAPVHVPDPRAHPYRVVLAKSGREQEVLPEVGLLATLESMEADIIVSCGGGICGACRTPWIEGPPIHHDRVLTPREREREVCVCVADCVGPTLVLDI
ncbi:PDR/VanB family oxidoreductase [uncultured Castellaniella sp.]|uniref:PDR/VanB family oxidoreductase n=1 Tax=uncultured Castellaniella sp. TaxID=647907 RepID=UPI00262C8F01|nr:PDR/VanB family oxidoreductase [uncultured Castellaniella sp.]